MKKIYLIMALAVGMVSCQPKNGSQKSEVATEENSTEQTTTEAEAEEGAEETETAQEALLDFSLPTQDGTEMNILEEVKKHQLTVIDFWASWCGPCRNEMPNMVKLQRDYQDKGLAIIGISLDDDYDAWTLAMKELGIDWLSLLDTDGEVARTFHVEFIPYTVIVNAEGKVLGTNLRGEELNNFVGKHL